MSRHCWQIDPTAEVITFYCAARHHCGRSLNLVREGDMPASFPGMVAAFTNLTAPIQKPISEGKLPHAHEHVHKA